MLSRLRALILPDRPPRRPRPAGFTVVELVLALLVMGALAALVMAKFADAKKKAYVDAEINDLRNYAIAQELYHDQYDGYGDTTALAAAGFRFTADVVPDSMALRPADKAMTWYLRVAHRKTDVRCWLEIAAGEDPDATVVQRKIMCTEAGVRPPTPQARSVDIGVDTLGAALPLRAAPAEPAFAYTKTLQFDVAPGEGTGGQFTNVRWAFGDGTTSTDRQPTKAYPRSGVYVVTMTATSATGTAVRAARTLHLVNLAPVATFDAAEDVGQASVAGRATVGGRAGVSARVAGLSAAQGAPISVPDGVTASDTVPLAMPLVFDAAASYDPDGRLIERRWDFGDFTQDTGVVARKRFDGAGTATVRLIAIDDQGAADTAFKTFAIGVKHYALTPRFTYAPAMPKALSAVQFDASGSTTAAPNGIEFYTWEFGDGSPQVLGAASVRPAHTYRKAGRYAVRLTVVAAGNYASVTDTLTVGAALDSLPTGLQGFWDPCASFGTQQLSDVVGGQHGVLGSTTGVDANDPIWALSMPVAGRTLAPATLRDTINGRQGVILPSTFKSDSVVHTIVTQVASWRVGSNNRLLSVAGQRFGFYIESNGTIDVSMWNQAGYSFGSDYSTGVALPRDGALHTLGATYDPRAAIVRFYLDGVEKWTTPYTRTPPVSWTGTTTSYGSDQNFGSSFAGNLGPFGYWPRVLGAGEMAQVHATLAARQCRDARTPASLTVAPDTLTLQPGATGLVTATLKDAAGAVLSDRIADWTAQDSAVATVDQAGVVTGRAVGRTWVYGSVDWLLDSALVRVEKTALPTTGLVAHWTACGGAGGQTLRDVAGPYSAVLGASAATEASDPVWQTALQTPTRLEPVAMLRFPEGSPYQYASLPPTFSSEVTRHTLMVVAATQANSTPGDLFLDGTGALGLQVSSTREISIRIWNQEGYGFGSSYGSGAYLPNDGRRHTVGLVVDPVADTAWMYLDGVKRFAKAYTRDFTITVSPTNPGKIGGSNSGEFPGSIGDVVYYNDALAPAQMAQVSAHLLAGTCEAGAPASLDVAPDPATTVPGGSVDLVATVRDAGGAILPNRAVSWSSRMAGIATADSAGRVTGVARGATYVIAETDWLLDSAAVNVTAAAEPTTGLVAHWTPCGGAGQVLTDVVGGFDGRLGSTTDADTQDPAWTAAGSAAAPIRWAVGGATPPAGVSPAPTRPMLGATIGAPEQYVALPASFGGGDATQHTLMAVVAVTGAGDGQVALSGNTLLGIRLNNNAQFEATLFNQDGYGYPQTFNTGASVPRDGSVHTVALVADQAMDSAFFYLDGVRKWSTRYTRNFVTGTGGTIGKADDEFPGMIGDVLYYARPLSAAEVAQTHVALLAAGCNAGAVGATVDVTPDTLTLALGANGALTAAVLNALGQPMAGRTVTWSSQIPAVATVDLYGGVRAAKLGRTWVRATLGDAADSALVIVTPVPPPPAPAAMWDPCTSSGTQTLKDVVGTAHGTLGGNASTTTNDPAWMPATPSDPVHLWAPNGPDNGYYVSLPAFAGSATTHTFMFKLKMPTGTPNGSGEVFYHPGNSLSMSVAAPYIWNNGGMRTFIGNSPVADGQWHVHTFVLDAATSKATYYVDGAVVGTPQPYVGTTLPSGTQLFRGSGYWLRGGMATVRYYDRALSATDVVAASSTLTTASCAALDQPVVARPWLGVTPATDSLRPAQVRQLAVTYFDALGVPTTNPAVTWASADTSVATVSSTGLVTARATGVGRTVQITATLDTLVGTAAITVVPAPIVSIDIEPTPDSIRVGGSKQLQIVGRDVDGNRVTGLTATWKDISYGTYTTYPSDYWQTPQPKFALTVSASGVATALRKSSGAAAAGDAIMASYTTADNRILVAKGKLFAVDPVANSLRVTPQTFTVSLGWGPYVYTVSAQAWALFSDGVTQSQSVPANVTWTSRNPGIATVDARGMGSGVTPGVTYLVAESVEGLKDSARVEVLPNNPPVADFAWTPSMPLPYDEVTFQSWSRDDANIWGKQEWDFGDFSPPVVYGDGVFTPTHTYSAPGVYTVRLIVTDVVGAADTATKEVTVYATPPAIAPVSVTLTCPTTAEPYKGYTCKATTSDPARRIRSAFITLDDWATKGPVSVPWSGDWTRVNNPPGQVDHLGYAVYTDSMVANPDGSFQRVAVLVASASATVVTANPQTTLNRAPIAAAKVNPSAAVIGQTVMFYGQGTDPDGDAIVKTEWDLGDWLVFTTPTASATYKTIGARSAVFSVTDARGAVGRASVSFEVVPAPTTSDGTVTARFSFSPDNMPVGNTIALDARASTVTGTGNSIVSYAWGYAEADAVGGSSGAQTTVRYSTPGAKRVTLTVRDAQGHTSTLTRTITVGAAIASVTINFNYAALKNCTNQPPSIAQKLTATLVDATGRVVTTQPVAWRIRFEPAVTLRNIGPYVSLQPGGLTAQSSTFDVLFTPDSGTWVVEAFPSSTAVWNWANLQAPASPIGTLRVPVYGCN